MAISSTVFRTRPAVVAAAAVAVALLAAGCSDDSEPTATDSAAKSADSALESAADRLPERAPGAQSGPESSSTAPRPESPTPGGETVPYPDRTDCQALDDSYLAQLDLSFADTAYHLTDAFQAESADGVTYISGTAENRDPALSTIAVWLFKDGGYYTLPGDAGTLTPGFVDGSDVLNASLDDPEARNVVECNANAVWQHGR